MKRALQNSMKSRCGFALQCIGLFAFLAGTAMAQSKQPTAADEQPPIEVRSTFPLRSGIFNPTPEAVEAMVAAARQIHFSVELVVADVETLNFWIGAHLDQIVELYPDVEDRETPGYIHPDIRQSLFATLRSDAGTSILTTPSLVTSWGRTISYKTISHENEDSFFSLSLRPKEVGKGKIGLAVTTRLHPDSDDTQIIGPDELNWDIQSPMDHTLMFPMADVEPAKKMFLLIKPSFAGTVSPHTDSPFFASRINGLSNAVRRSLFGAGAEVAQEDGTKDAERLETSDSLFVDSQASPVPVSRGGGQPGAAEAAVLQMLVLDVDSKIANNVLSKTRTSEDDDNQSDASRLQTSNQEKAGKAKEPRSTSRGFTMDATLGKLFVADLRKQDESFRVVSRPQVRSLLGVAAALEVRGGIAPNQKVADVGSLNIHVTPKKIDDELVVRTWLSLSQLAKPSPDSDSSSGPKFEAESTVKCPLGSTAVMVLGNDESERAILMLTDVVSVQQVQIQPRVAVQQPVDAPVVSKSPRPAKTPLPYATAEIPETHADLEVMLQRSQSLMTHSPISRFATSHPKIVDVQQEAPNMISLRGLKPGTATVTLWVDESRNPVIYRVEVPADSAVVSDSAVVQASGVQQSIPKDAPMSEVQQVLDEVREMRKLIQGLRDDMSLLRDSVKQPEQKTSQNDVWIQKGDSQVFTRGRNIIQVSGQDPAVIEVQALAADRLRLTGKKPGRTALKCLFVGDAVPTTFTVEVFAADRRSATKPLGLVPRAADHLPGEKVYRTNPTREPVAVQRGPQEVSDDNTFSLTVSKQGDSARRLIEEAMKKETSIDIDDGTLLDAIRQLHETAGINIAVDTRALEEEGVSTDARVSIHVAGVSLRSVLKLLLSEHNLAVLIEDEVLKVTSKQRAAGRQTVVAYRVAEFVGQGADGQADFDELISLITTVVEPDSWQEVGGNGSVAANLPTSALVVRQTQDVHEQIQQLLSALRNWTETAGGDAVLPAPIAVGVDELEGGRFSGFTPIENAQPSLDVPASPVGPISTGNDSLPEPARPPGNTGAPIELPLKR